MSISNRKEPLLLFVGDIFFLVVSLWLALLIRYGEARVWEQFEVHIVPFSVLFVAWVVIFFIAGLYEKHTLLLRTKLPGRIFSAQVVNTLLAVLFFYFIPYLTIAPKTNLFIYLVLSFGFVLVWRHSASFIISARRRYKTAVLSTEREAGELMREINHNSRYYLSISHVVDVDACSAEECVHNVRNIVEEGGVSHILIDMHHPKVAPMLPELYRMLFEGLVVLDMAMVYEEVFDRVPLSLVRHGWFFENLTQGQRVYDSVKRIMDIFVSAICGLVSLIFYPFIILAISLESGFPFFYVHERVGKDGKPFRFYKFRTMTTTDTGEEALESKGRVTNVGVFLRATRLDELPQLWNVLKGDLSFVGPRPEFPTLSRVYRKEIPYYDTRYLVKPGVTGWAQMYHDNHPHHGTAVEETKEKLSYDLYYIKNRSLTLDIIIALKTLKVFFTRSGK